MTSQGRMQCPFCHAYDVARLYLASADLDSCTCASCGSAWDEDRSSGEYRGRADPASVLIPGHRARRRHEAGDEAAGDTRRT